MKINKRALLVIGVVYSCIPLTFLAKYISLSINKDMPTWIAILVGWVLIISLGIVLGLILWGLITISINILAWINEYESIEDPNVNKLYEEWLRNNQK